MTGAARPSGSAALHRQTEAVYPEKNFKRKNFHKVSASAEKNIFVDLEIMDHILFLLGVRAQLSVK